MTRGGARAEVFSPLAREGERGRGGEGETDRERVLATLWSAMKRIEDPEIPVSLVDMGLIVSVDYDAAQRAANLKITYTAMGCPAMDMIQDDIRTRLLQLPEVQRVNIETVWDPIWTPRRLSKQAKDTMRHLGLAV